jgi:hypothetical protein
MGTHTANTAVNLDATARPTLLAVFGFCAPSHLTSFLDALLPHSTVSIAICV